MYTAASSQEQILHNNIIVAQALTSLSLNIDVQVNSHVQKSLLFFFKCLCSDSVVRRMCC